MYDIIYEIEYDLEYDIIIQTYQPVPKAYRKCQPVPKAYRKCCVKFRSTPTVRSGLILV